MLLVTSIKEFYIKGVGYYINGDGKYLRLSSENLLIQEFPEHNVRKKTIQPTKNKWIFKYKLLK